MITFVVFEKDGTSWTTSRPVTTADQWFEPQLRDVRFEVAIAFSLINVGKAPANVSFGGTSTFLEGVTAKKLTGVVIEPGQEWEDTYVVQGETKRSKLARRRSAAVFMFADETGEASRAALAAGLTPKEVSSWGIATWNDADRGRPAVSIFRSVMIDKLLTGHTWEGNDLTDLMYLSTAAGYCDFAAGDRRTIALLRQSKRRLGIGADLHSDLTSLVRSLDLRLEMNSLGVGSGS